MISSSPFVRTHTSRCHVLAAQLQQLTMEIIQHPGTSAVCYRKHFEVLGRVAAMKNRGTSEFARNRAK